MIASFTAAPHILTDVCLEDTVSQAIHAQDLAQYKTAEAFTKRDGPLVKFHGFDLEV